MNPRLLSACAVLALGAVACGGSQSSPPPAAAPGLVLPSNFQNLIGGMLGGSAGAGMPDLSKLIGGALGGSGGLGDLLGAGGLGGLAPAASPPAAAPAAEQKAIGSEESAIKFAALFGQVQMRAMVDLDSTKADAMSTADCTCRSDLAKFITLMKGQNWHVNEFKGTARDHKVIRLADGYRLDELDSSEPVPILDSTNKTVFSIPEQKDIPAWMVVRWVDGAWKIAEVSADSSKFNTNVTR